MLNRSLCSFCFVAGAFHPRTVLTVLQFVCAHLQACMTAACVHGAPELVWPLLKRKACGTADKVRGNCRFSVSFSAEFQGKQRNRESPENRLSYCAASPPPEACENEKLILYTPPERGRRCDADGAPRGVERSRKKTLVTPSTWIGMTRTSRRTRSSPCGPRNWSLAQFAYEIRSLQDSFSMITRFDLSTYQR